MLGYRFFTNNLRKHSFIKNNLTLIRRAILTSTFNDVEIPKVTTAEYFFSCAMLYPDNIAYIDDQRGKKYTYSDTIRCIHAIASSLTKKGVSAGTMTGIVALNSPEYIMLLWALSSIGCPVTTCNYNYTKSEMEKQLNDSKPSILFTDEPNLSKVIEASSNIPNLKDIYIIGDPLPSYGSVDKLMEDNGNMSPIGQLKIDLDSVALMPYSSGTTGLPKGVMLTHSNLVSNMAQLKVAHPIIGCKIFFVNLPLYHIYSTMVTATMGFMSGSTVVVQPKFDAIKFLEAIEKYKVSVLHLVPPQVLFFLNHPEVSKYDLSSVEKCFCAAAPLDAIVEKKFIQWFRVHQPKFNLFQGYGLSETSPITHITPDIPLHTTKQGSVGLLLPNMKSKVVDINTRAELGVNEQGELLLQGPNIMKGYYGKASASEKAFEDGWFLTGDICRYDEDQYFYLTDRIKELIKVKGLQVAPAELEAVLLSHDAISDCAVVGIPHENCGEVPRAFIVKAKEVEEKEIHRHISEHLCAHKYLRGGIVFVNEIPKSPSGKLLRRLLK